MGATNETKGLHDFLSGLKSMEKDLTRMSNKLTSELGDNFEKVMNQQIYEGERRMKINKNDATVQLAKDGSLRIVFDDPEGAKNFYNGKK